MRTKNEQEKAIKLYRWCFDELCMIHMKSPTVLETILYMYTITDQDIENILKIMKDEKDEETDTK